MKKLLILSLLVSFNLNAEPMQYMGIGVGVHDCGQFLSATSAIEINYYKNYMGGFITALNMKHGSMKGENSSIDAIYYAMKNECSEIPLGRFEQVLYRFWSTKLT
tara:strand:+ start:266 stop:580 length:315 start_codon:yes stop_codon:yes gene_type:complete